MQGSAQTVGGFLSPAVDPQEWEVLRDELPWWLKASQEFQLKSAVPAAFLAISLKESGSVRIFVWAVSEERT